MGEVSLYRGILPMEFSTAQAWGSFLLTGRQTTSVNFVYKGKPPAFPAGIHLGESAL